MLVTSRMAVGAAVCAGVCTAGFPGVAMAARYADVPGYFEPGSNLDVVYGSSPIEYYNNPQAALGGPGELVALAHGTQTGIVSLGGWSDDPTTGSNDRTPGLVVGFSTTILNAPGNDLLIVGNAPSTFSFYEPGFVEVAAESDGGGAAQDGWQDETFYLIRPNNYGQINDPRLADNAISIINNPDFSLSYSPPFDNKENLESYFDVNHGGDGFDLDNAIDLSGNPVSLNEIAYVRMRSVSDSAFPFGSFLSPEVDYLQSLVLEGDFNADGFVGVDDLNVVLTAWNTSVPAGSFADGDANADGFIGVDDLNVVLTHWNHGTPPADRVLIPEPTALFVIGLVPLALCARRRG